MIRLLTTFLLVILFTGCSSTAKRDHTTDWDAQKLYTEANKSLQAENYTKAIDYYHRHAER